MMATAAAPSLPANGADRGSIGSKDKPPALACAPTRDGRLYFHLSFAATLSRSKVVYVIIFLALIAIAMLSPTLLGQHNILKRRVRELEARLAKRVHWLLQHREHLQEHVRSGWTPQAHEDGRMHLLSPPDGISKLAEALAPNTEMAEFDDHYLCGSLPATEADVIKKKVAIAAVSWRAPKSLRNSMESWRAGGLLDIVDERMLFLNSPTDEDRAIALEYNFDVYVTDEYNGNVMAGPSIAYLVGNTSADYVLFMEKDFILSSPRETMMREMYVGIQHLARGVDVYRLRGRTDYPAEGMPDCCAKSDPPACPFHSNWRSGGFFGDHQNWLLAFCDPNAVDNSNGRLVKCSKEPLSLCYGSSDTNWSNNPCLFSKVWFDEKIRDIALHGELAYTENRYFEFNVLKAWLEWTPPAIVCHSDAGIFTHFEIDQ